MDTNNDQKNQIDTTNSQSSISSEKPQITQQAQNSEAQAITNSPRSKSLPFPLIILFLIIAFFIGLIISAWYFQTKLQEFNNTAKPEVGEVITQPKTLIIGTDPTDPPMEFINKQGGLVGYDVDLGYKLANEIGVRAEFKNIAWEDIFKELLDKKIDMIIDAVTITDERKQKYGFSEPYLNAGQVIVSRKDNLITSLAALKGKKISVQKDTTNEKEAIKFTDPNLVLRYEAYTDAAKALSEGKVDAMITDLTLAKGFVGQYDNLKISSDPFTNEYYGIVVRKEDTQLLKKINDSLNSLRTKGILIDLKQKWLD
jgi:polar amino acid transport system substrate-binding protein